MDTKRNGGGLIVKILLLFCVGAALFSAWKLWGFYQSYRQGEKEYEDLTAYVKKKDTEKQKSEKNNNKEDPCPVTVDFEALKKVNEDVAGWIYIPDTEVNYPIVQGEDNAYYLNHTFEKQDNFTGAIFLDALCQSDFSSDNSIIYGHNLKSGAMFGYLKKLYDISYNEKADYREHPVIWVLSPESVKKYRIFAAREISAAKEQDVYTVEFSSPEEYGVFLKEQKEVSSYETDTKIDSADAMITLSTCTSDSEDGRFIVQAVLIRETGK